MKLFRTGIILVCLFGICGVVLAETTEQLWGEFLHYAKIGRLDLAKSYGQKLIDSNPDPVEVLELSRENPFGYELILKMYANSEDLKEIAGSVLDIIEQGRLDKKTNSGIIAEEIKRLSSTTRGRFTAIERLKNSGEYAVPLMINAMLDSSRKGEFAEISDALGQIGRAAVRPLTAALQVDDIAVKSEIIRALGRTGYSEALGYLKFILEKDDSAELKTLAEQAIKQIDSGALNLTSAELFFSLANDYYYHKDSVAVVGDTDFGNIWFWDSQKQSLVRQEININYFYELMAMRSCEWALRADPTIGKAIGLWIAAFFKAESAGIEMPKYFDAGHPNASTYAQTAGAEYLHQALQRALKDNNGYIALGVIEALAINAGEKSLLYRVGLEQPLIEALSFEDLAVRYSSAIAIALANPAAGFPESKLIAENLADAIKNEPKEGFTDEKAYEYAIRSMNAMLKLLSENNKVVDLAPAMDAVIAAAKDERENMKVLAGKVLARFNSPQAQRAIAEMALNDSNPLEIRKEAFSSLAVSAKINGNMLTDEQIEQIYKLTASLDIDSQLRLTAAGAYGSLNLPSAKVKDLILDQAKM